MTHLHDGHDCGHEHAHGTEVVQDELKTLAVLLDHWVKHNASHQESFKEWAKKAEVFGKTETSKAICTAVACIDEANRYLDDAKKHIR